MAENLTADGLMVESLNMDIIRRRFNELSSSVDDVRNSSDESIPEPKRLLEDFKRNLSALTENPDFEALSPDDLESYIEQLKKELYSAEEETIKISQEIDTIENIVSADSAQLDGELEAFSILLNLIDTKGMFSTQTGIPIESPFSDGVLECQVQVSEEYKFKVLELSQQIVSNRSKLTTLEDFQHALKRVETICSFEDLFCGVKCIQYEDNCIRLSLKTPIPSLDSLSFKRKLDFSMEFASLDHELLIELTEKMELKNIEIFPGDVHLDGVINTLNSSRFLPITAVEDNLGWLIRQIQQRIILCTLRRLLVKESSISRFSVIYSDHDEMVTAHVGGLIASVKISQGWPLSNYPLMLRSLKHSDRNSSNISWSLLFKIQEEANSLDIETRLDLKHFIDSIEKLVAEMQAENADSNTSS